MTLPPQDVLQFVIRRTASLQHHLGSEFGSRTLVLPNGKFFPDKFTGDAASLELLMHRVQVHAGMSDVPIETRIIGAGSTEQSACGKPTGEKAHSCKGDCGGKGCDGCDGSCHDRDARAASAPTQTSSGGCGSGCGTSCGEVANPMGDEPRLRDLGDRWQVQVPAIELKQPLALTTNLARIMGYVFLVETRSATHPTYAELDVTAELASTLLGFGALLLSGAHVYSKSCGGPRIGRMTALGCGELALATVLFARRHRQELKPMLKELEATQRAAVQEAEQWLDERPRIVEFFNDDPLRLEREELPTTVTATSLWSKVFGTRAKHARTTSDPDASLAELETLLSHASKPATQQRSHQPDPRRDELRALVDEALADSGSQIQ